MINSSPQTLYDHMALVKDMDAAQATFTVIDTLQKLPQHEQLLAMSSLFILLCEKYNVSERNVLEYADHIMKDADRKDWRPEYKAIKQYLKEEL